MDIERATKRITTILLVIILSPIITLIFITALIASILIHEDKSDNTSND